jgi:hypothetical protein
LACLFYFSSQAIPLNEIGQGKGYLARVQPEKLSFLHVPVSSGLEGLVPRVHTFEGGTHKHRDVWVLRFDSAAQVDAVTVRKNDVQQNCVAPALPSIQRFLRGAGLLNVKPIGQHQPEPLPDHLFIVGDKHSSV